MRKNSRIAFYFVYCDVCFLLMQCRGKGNISGGGGGGHESENFEI